MDDPEAIKKKIFHAMGCGILSRKGKLPDAIHELEKQMIEEAMVRSGGNQRMASEILGITERMLGYRLKHYGFKSFI